MTRTKNNSTSRFLFVWDLTIIQHSFNMREKQRLVVVVVYIKPPDRNLQLTCTPMVIRWKGMVMIVLATIKILIVHVSLAGMHPFFVHTSTNLCLSSSHGHHLRAIPSPYFTAKHPKPRRITQRLWRILTSPVSPSNKKLDIKNKHW